MVAHSLESRQRLNESYPAVAESITAARGAIAEFAHAAGGREKRVQEIALAVSEALTNVVLHAYPARPGRIHVTAELAGGELWVLIADSGCGLHAGRESDGLGLGLVLISEMSDGFTVVERSSGGTELRICFDLRAGNARADQPRGSVASATRPASARFSTTR
jgi:serine/threonine-protein kinase RsbW